MLDNCIVLVNKERGMSSNKVVNTVKFALKAKKAGHLGTLDVLGEGLLPVTLGKATKLFDYFLNKDKVYRTIFKFGETTETLDLEGDIIHKDDKVITLEQVNNTIPFFIGKLNQMPPIFSAKKIKGRKAYELAREGKNVELKPKEIEVYNIKCLEQKDFNTFEFEIHCSSGTYIRSLCRDIAEKMSTCGVMYSIQRTRCGVFDIKNSFSLEQIKNNDFEVVQLDTLFNYEKLKLNEIQFKKLINGAIAANDRDGIFRAYYNDDYLGNVKVENKNMSFILRLF